MSKQSKTRRFKARHRFEAPPTEEVTSRKREHDSVASVTCPKCQGTLYIGPKLFFHVKLPLTKETLNHIVLHCIKCRTVCKVEVLEGVEFPEEKPRTRPSRIPNMYRPPNGGPLRWQDDVSGVLPGAVKAFVTGTANDDQVELVRDWCQYYIEAPCWDLNPHLDEEGRAELARIRARAKELHDAKALQRWIHECLGIGLDPL